MRLLIKKFNIEHKIITHLSQTGSNIVPLGEPSFFNTSEFYVLYIYIVEFKI